jgi:hypothetical protein
MPPPGGDEAVAAERAPLAATGEETGDAAAAGPAVEGVGADGGSAGTTSPGTELGEGEEAPLDQVRKRLAALNVDAPPAPAAPSGATPAARSRRPRRAARWIGPREDGSCRDSYPVKVKLRSGLYHLPGMIMYDRTRADRCYKSAEDAIADGFEQAKR